MRRKLLPYPRGLQRAFTLLEMVFTMFSVGVLGIVLAVFGFNSSRFIARNLATNHSNEAARISAMSLLKEARDSATGFVPATYNGTTFSKMAPLEGSADQDVLLKPQMASARRNAVTFRQLVSGPLQITSNIANGATVITVKLHAGAAAPMVQDWISLPLVGEQFVITGVSGTGTSRTLTVHAPILYTLNAASPNFLTASIYREVAYSVYNNQLRFHPNTNTAATANSFTVIRGNISSPSPFSVIMPETSGDPAYNLRVSLEITDLGYSSRKFRNGTTTLYTVIPVRNSLTAIKDPNS